MAKTETKYFRVEEDWKRSDSGEWESERDYLTTNLQPLYAKYSGRFDDLAAWTEAILGNTTAQRIAGFTVREATKEDLEDFNDDLEVIEAIEAFRQADIVANETKKTTRSLVAKWFSDNVTSERGAKAFFATHKLNPFQFAAWIKVYEEPNDAGTERKNTISDESLKALVGYWTGKNAVLKGDQKKKANDAAAFRDLNARAEAL